MINQEAYAVCKQRGAHAGFGTKFWERCEWCGMWYREVRTIEEREDAPPAAEQSPLAFLRGQGK